LLFALLPGCIEPFVEGVEGTAGDGTDDDATSSSTSGAVTTGSTPVSTTVVTSGVDSSTTVNVGEVVLACGNGQLDGDEECDEGADNADDGACTRACKTAVCGDKLVQLGVEACDDGEMLNDLYGFCRADCTGMGPFCGDGAIQSAQGEECDEPGTIQAGCLSSCFKARTCQHILDDADGHENGVYTIWPDGDHTVKVYCDLESIPMRGMTFLKVNMTDVDWNPVEMPANLAQIQCEKKYYMQLFVPRSAEHLSVAWRVATEETELKPVGGGTDPISSEYLQVLAVQPVTPGESCEGKPLNSEECPEWEAADKFDFFISSEGLPDQPGANNCEGCSPFFEWNDDGTLKSIETFMNGGDGATSEYFMCDVAYAWW
jgi:hypothetical protein